MLRRDIAARGEDVAVELMKQAATMLTRRMNYRTPEQDLRIEFQKAAGTSATRVCHHAGAAFGITKNGAPDTTDVGFARQLRHRSDNDPVITISGPAAWCDGRRLRLTGHPLDIERAYL